MYKIVTIWDEIVSVKNKSQQQNAYQLFTHYNNKTRFTY